MATLSDGANVNEQRPMLTAHGRAQCENLIRAAFDLIAERGLEHLRTRDVAARAGVNIATLHYYFPSKEDLIRGVAGFVHRELSETYNSRTPGDALSPLEALRIELRDDGRTLRDNPAIYDVLIELYARAHRDPAIAAIVTELGAHWQEHIAGIIDEGIRQGVFRSDLDPAFAALALTSFMKGALVSALVDRERYPLIRITSELETLLTGKPAQPIDE